MPPKSLGKRSCSAGLHLQGQSRKRSKLAWKFFFAGIPVCFHPRGVTSGLYTAPVEGLFPAKRLQQPCQIYSLLCFCVRESRVYVCHTWIPTQSLFWLLVHWDYLRAYLIKLETTAWPNSWKLDFRSPSGQTASLSRFCRPLRTCRKNTLARIVLTASVPYLGKNPKGNGEWQQKYEDKVTGLAKHFRATEHNIIGHQSVRARVHLASSCPISDSSW